MALIDPLIAEFQMEAATTRKVLALCPEKEFSWKPHAKSMTLQQLASHIAEIPTWLTTTLTTTELDFAKSGYKPFQPATIAELLSFFDKTVADAQTPMKNATDADLGVNWTLRMGEKIFFTQPRAWVVRAFVFSHLIHHRGQLCVYLRLLNIPLPQIYGPTADAPDM